MLAGSRLPANSMAKMFDRKRASREFSHDTCRSVAAAGGATPRRVDARSPRLRRSVRRVPAQRKSHRRTRVAALATRGAPERRAFRPRADQTRPCLRSRSLRPSGQIPAHPAARHGRSAARAAAAPTRSRKIHPRQRHCCRFRQENRLPLAVTDPLDLGPVDALAYSTGLAIELRMRPPPCSKKPGPRLYGQKAGRRRARRRRCAREDASEFDLQRLRDIANEAPVIRRVNQIVADAIEARASDIHIEPTLEAVLVRYRIDGVLRTADALPPGLKAAIASRIKIMARLDIAERRLPQDGRIKLAVRGVDIDFRVSTMPDGAWREHRAAHSRPQPDRAGLRRARLRARRRSGRCARSCTSPTASCSSRARPAAARRRRSTRR